jgi:hypothetical protein
MKCFVAIVLSLTALAGAAQAQGPTPTAIWNAIGNTAAVDEGDLSIYQFHDTGSVAIRESVSTGTLDLHYNVPGLAHVEVAPPPVDPEGHGHCVALRAVVRDTGAGARVVVRLKQLDLFRGTGVTTLGTIDSNTSGLASTEYHRFEKCLSLPHDFQFEYGQFVYFIEAQLIKSAATANPGLKAVSVCNRTTMCDDN